MKWQTTSLATLFVVLYGWQPAYAQDTFPAVYCWPLAGISHYEVWHVHQGHTRIRVVECPVVFLRKVSLGDWLWVRAFRDDGSVLDGFAELRVVGGPDFNAARRQRLDFCEGAP